MSKFGVVIQQLRERLAPLDNLSTDLSHYQQAAVSLMLRNHDDEAEILFIKRAERPLDPWSGHLALPGGRAEVSDPDLRAVAVRETLEEVGIDLDSGGLFLGRLDTLQPVTQRLPPIMITPLVAVAPPQAVPLPNQEEVADVFWMPVAEFKARGRSEIHHLIVQGHARQWPAYPSPRGVIWGMTERIVTQFLALLD